MAYFTDNPNWYISKKLCTDPDLTVLAPTGWYAKEGLVRRWENHNYAVGFSPKRSHPC